MGEEYTKIPNSVLGALMRYGFNGTQLAVLLAIARKTYGWQKPSDVISASQVARMTGRRREVVARTISDLEKMGVLRVEHLPKQKNDICIANPSEWDQSVTNSSHPDRDQMVTENVTNSSHTKEKRKRGACQLSADSAPPKETLSEYDAYYEGLMEQVRRMKANGDL